MWLKETKQEQKNYFEKTNFLLNKLKQSVRFNLFYRGQSSFTHLITNNLYAWAVTVLVSVTGPHSQQITTPTQTVL